jgi:hypothetical protein
MTAGPYNPVTFTSESLTQAKFEQMANNEQWLFENMPRIRYNAAGIVRDAQVKIIAGKIPYAPGGDPDGVEVKVYFGSYFTAGCKPVVVSSSENVNTQALIVQLNGLGGEIDQRGFNAHIQDREPPSQGGWKIQSGWVHWIAIGW